jgi:hypothetical protein
MFDRETFGQLSPETGEESLAQEKEWNSDLHRNLRNVTLRPLEVCGAIG